MKPQSLESN